MAEISKPNFNYLWSSGGAVVAPSNVKIQTGWTAEVPPFQWENWSQNRQDQGIAHILQHGISVWDALTEYQSGKSYVTGSNGRIYVAVQTNTNQNPTTDVSEVYWADFFLQGYVVLSATTTWTVPPILKLGLKKPLVTVVAAGGGGGGAVSTANYNAAGGGGGAGGTSTRLVDLTGVSSVISTIGAGGAGGPNGVTNGSAGGSSSFAGFESATGGAGGNSATALSTTTGVGSGNLGGVGSGGTLNVRGHAGQGAVAASPTIAGGTVVGGFGGGSTVSGAGGFGAGGSGAATAGASQTIAGSVGVNGVIIIQW